MIKNKPMISIMGTPLVRGRSCVQSTPAAPLKAHKSRAFAHSQFPDLCRSIRNVTRTRRVDSWKIRGVCSPDVLAVERAKYALWLRANNPPSDSLTRYLAYAADELEAALHGAAGG